MFSKWLCTIVVAAAASAHAAPNNGASTSTSQPSDLDLLLGIGHSGLSRLGGMREQANVLLNNALDLIGMPYRYGGANAETGFDCSGLVRAVFAESWGKMLPRSAVEQAAATDKIDKAELEPGDLVFFNTMRRTFSHVGIYMGDGKFLHAPRTGAQVRVDDMGLAYWQKRFDGARRVGISEEARNKLMQQLNIDGLDAQDLIGRVSLGSGLKLN